MPGPEIWLHVSVSGSATPSSVTVAVSGTVRPTPAVPSSATTTGAWFAGVTVKVAVSVTMNSVSLTFGLLNCNGRDKVTADSQLRRFASTNFDRLASDIVGGARAGLKTCWFDPDGGGLPDGAEVRPDHRIVDLAELVGLL